jgi:hypothetical protein
MPNGLAQPADLKVGNGTQNWPVFEVKVGNGHSLLVPLLDGLVPSLQGEPDSPEGDSCFHVVFSLAG